MRNLPRLIDRSNAQYSARFSRDLLDRMMFVGDPVADAAVAALHERSYDRRAAKLEAVRALAAEGEPAARLFVEETTAQPTWLDEKLLARGQKVTLGFVALSRLSLLHSLFAGGVFARATLVTRATGRLGADPSTRIRETGAFIGAIMQPGGMAPGAIGHETTLRVRLLHSSIRAWVGQTAGFAASYVGAPIDQTMLAMTLGLFSYLNLRSFSRLGVRFGDEDLAGHHHLWRYVGHVLGIDDALLTTSLAQERDLWSALVAHQAFPDEWGRLLLDESVRTAARVGGNVRELRSFFRAMFLQLSGSEWFGVDEPASFDHRLLALRVGAGVSGLRRRFVPGMADSMAQRGLAAFEHSVQLARTHDYGVKIETPEERAKSEAAMLSLGAQVRERFAHLRNEAPPVPHFDAGAARRA